MYSSKIKTYLIKLIEPWPPFDAMALFLRKTATVLLFLKNTLCKSNHHSDFKVSVGLAVAALKTLPPIVKMAITKIINREIMNGKASGSI